MLTLPPTLMPPPMLPELPAPPLPLEPPPVPAAAPAPPPPDEAEHPANESAVKTRNPHVAVPNRQNRMAGLCARASSVQAREPGDYLMDGGGGAISAIQTDGIPVARVGAVTHVAHEQ